MKKPIRQPFAPGSDEAVAAGCLCPVIDNRYGLGAFDFGDGCYWINDNCPIHGRNAAKWKPSLLSEDTKAILTILIHEVQSCKTKKEQNELLQSWIDANDLHPEQVNTIKIPLKGE